MTLLPALRPLGPPSATLDEQQALHALEDVVFQDAALVVQVLAHLLQLRLLDAEGTRVLVHAVAGEHAHVDDGAVHARRHAQRGVLHVGGLLAEDRAQQLLFRGQLGLALRRDLAHQDVAGLHFRADVGDARLIQLGQGRLAHVGDVRGDLLGTELGVAGDAGQLLDVDGRETVFLHHALGDEDGVLEVVAVPGHERDQQVLAQRQLAHVGGRTVRQGVAARDHVARHHQRTLVHAGVLVGTGVLGQVVDVHARFAGHGLLVVDAHHDAGSVHGIHHAAAAGDHAHAGVAGHGALDAGAHQGLLGHQRRHRLALHVRTHERAVRVVVLQERDQRSRHRHDLLRRHVDEADLVRGGHGELVLVTAAHQVRGEAAAVIHLGVGLGDDVLAFLDGGQEHDLVGDAAVLHLAVRRLEEAVGVGAGVHGQRVDEADVRTFRGLDRAHAAVVGRVHVAHLEAGALAGQAAGSQCRHAALVGDLGERVVLVHELRELRGAEELLDRGRHRLGVDQFLGHQALGLGQRQALLHGALDAHQADAEHVLRHLTHGTHAAVAEVVDVVHHAVAVADVDQHAQRVDDVGAVAEFLH